MRNSWVKSSKKKSLNRSNEVAINSKLKSNSFKLNEHSYEGTSKEQNLFESIKVNPQKVK